MRLAGAAGVARLVLVALLDAVLGAERMVIVGLGCGSGPAAMRTILEQVLVVAGVGMLVNLKAVAAVMTVAGACMRLAGAAEVARLVLDAVLSTERTMFVGLGCGLGPSSMRFTISCLAGFLARSVAARIVSPKPSCAGPIPRHLSLCHGDAALGAARSGLGGVLVAPAECGMFQGCCGIAAGGPAGSAGGRPVCPARCWLTAALAPASATAWGLPAAPPTRAWGTAGRGG